MKKLINLLVIPVVLAIIGSVAAVLVERQLNKDDEEAPAVLSIASDANTLLVTNNSDQLLFVLVAYNVRAGNSPTLCYPLTNADDNYTEHTRILPGGTVSIAPRNCRDITGYAVWAWNNQGTLVFEISN